jgi:hypothetical protein
MPASVRHSARAASLRDLRWIREPFLSDTRDHGMVVVHGHTISEDVEASALGSASTPALMPRGG